MSRTITSPANPLLKDVRRAITRRGLTSDGLMVAESFHLLKEALASNLEVRTVLAAASARESVGTLLGETRSGCLRVVEDKLFQSVAATDASQGVIALVQPPGWALDDIFRQPALAVVLDGLQDPGNAGAILRTAEAFGATGAVFLEGAVSPFNPKTLRATAGSVFRLPFVHGVEAKTVLDAVRESKILLITASARDGADPRTIDLKKPTALVIGSEAHGPAETWLREAQPVRIPTAGVESLNASIAAAVLLYEASRQRRGPTAQERTR